MLGEMFGIISRLFCCLTLLFYAINGIILRLPDCNKFDAAWTEFYYDEILKGSKHSLVSDHTMVQCLEKCMLYPKCRSVSVKEDEKLCMLHHSRHDDEKNKLEMAEGWTHIETDDTLENIGPYCNANRPCEGYDICVDTCSGEQYECYRYEEEYEINESGGSGGGEGGVEEGGSEKTSWSRIREWWKGYYRPRNWRGRRHF